jgi:hypothetical protein
MDKYIGTKIIEAELAIRKGGKVYAASDQVPKSMEPVEEGYKVKYQDGYESWSPKDVFEKAYLKIIPNPRLKTDISISQQMVDEFIKEVHPSTIGDKTTMVRAVLVNGFEMVESSACVDKENYSEEIGTEMCLKKIKDKVWVYLGFLLQTGVGGVQIDAEAEPRKLVPMRPIAEGVSFSENLERYSE